MTTIHRSKNTMFYRADAAVKVLSRDQRWVDFNRACGRCGLFFDDIDPINDDPKKDVTDRMRGAGYQAIAFRTDQDRRGFYIQVFVSRGTGANPVEAVRDAYRQAVAAGDPVKAGLDKIFDGPFRALGEFPATVEMLPQPEPTGIHEFIAEAEARARAACGINIEDLIG